MNISPLTFADCQDAATLHKQAFFRGWTESVFQEFLQTPITFGLKVEENNTFSGYILWREIKDEAEILTLVIAPSNRQKGCGSALLTALFTILKDKGILHLFIEVAEDNDAAISFYRKHGFVFYGKRPHYYPREENKHICALNFVKDLV
ncbi:MAG: ribosomal protein S18-alanine N-acetyltransferase [Proteobacteria bacterium]|nr:ribosomal protein S18-alanine N-acetyltransferase [Pseudomonadota bacterium]